MSHHHTFMQKLFDSVVESLGRTQASHISHAYKSYVGDAPTAYFAYAAMTVYFAYRCKQAYNDRKLCGEIMDNNKGQNGDSAAKYEKANGNRKLDTAAMGLCFFASLTACNWSIAPIMQVPHFVALMFCCAAEGVYHQCGANAKNRGTCYISNQDKLGTRCKKWLFTAPFMNLALETVGVTPPTYSK